MNSGRTSSWIGVVITFILISVAWIVMALTGNNPIKMANVKGESMEPFLYDGDHGFIISFEECERYDIVVFHTTVDGEDTLLIKRVIGMPGDCIQCHSHVMTVNGDPIIEFAKNPSVNEDFDRVVVPDGHYFVAGDNRDNSLDSRSVEVGMVDESQMVGVFHLVR